MECKRIYTVFIVLACCFTACDINRKQNPSCLAVNESRVVSGVKFDLLTKIYHESSAQEYSDFFFKVYVKISDVGKGRSLLFSSKGTEEYNRRYNYLSFQAGRDFMLKIDTASIFPIGYTFLPSNEVSQYDELVYSFRLPKKIFAEQLCSELNIQYWYMDHIAGTGNVCFRP